MSLRKKKHKPSQSKPESIKQSEGHLVAWVPILLSTLAVITSIIGIYFQFFRVIDKLTVSIHNLHIDREALTINPDVVFINSGNRSAYIEEAYYIVGEYGIEWSEIHPEISTFVVDAGQMVNVNLPARIEQEFIAGWKKEEFAIQLIVRSIDGGAQKHYGEFNLARFKIKDSSIMTISTSVSEPGEHGPNQIFEVY